MKEHFWILSRQRRLAAMLHMPQQCALNKPGFVFCHGFTGDKVGANQLMRNLAEGLEIAGSPSLRFDFAGSGDSEGSFAEDTTISGWRTDLLHVVEWLRKRTDWQGRPLFVLGHSLGGLIALLHSEKSGDIAGRVALAPVVHPIENFRDIILGKELWESSAAGNRVANFYGKGFALAPDFVEDLLANEYDPLKAAKGCKTPLLILHGSADVAVPLTGSAELHALYHGLKEFQTVEGADHVFAGRHAEIASRIADWALKYQGKSQ